MLVSRAAALARVRRVVPTGTFSAFSSVTARRVAALAWETSQYTRDDDIGTRHICLFRRGKVWWYVREALWM